MAGRELTAKQRLFVELLPVHNFNIALAGIAAGYTETFAKDRLATQCKKSAALSKAVKAKTEEIQAKITGEWSLDGCKDKLAELYKLSVDVGDRTNAKSAVDSMIRMQGGFIDRSHNINENIDYRPPTEPQERLQWLKSEVRLLERQLNAGTAIAGQDQLSFEKG